MPDSEGRGRQISPRVPKPIRALSVEDTDKLVEVLRGMKNRQGILGLAIVTLGLVTG